MTIDDKSTKKNLNGFDIFDINCYAVRKQLENKIKNANFAYLAVMIIFDKVFDNIVSHSNVPLGVN